MSWHAHVLVLVALTGCSASTEPARSVDQAGGAVIAPAFARADRSGDKVVSEEEWATDGTVLFDQLDRNQDQAIDAAELRDAFDILDLDGDRAIGPEEAGDLVARGDADGDGRLSPAEFGQLDWERLSADLNRDGRISRREFYDSRDQLFLAADPDRDRRLGAREIDPVQFPLFRF
jgi:EF hand/EF-hand domain pair